MPPSPPAIQSLFDRAWAAQQTGQIDTAMALYRDILARQENGLAWLGLGQCQLEARQKADALVSFKRASALAPQSTAVRYMVNMLEGGVVPDRAPDDYVQWVFDGSAASFEAHLSALDYRGPQMIQRLAARDWPKGSRKTILDLGCGTGLNAPLFRPFASRLDGVDLAPQMLQQSMKRGYDALYKAEVHAFLGRPPRRYDAILATDVLIYIGRLDPLFVATATSALNPGGEILCTIELGDDAEDVRLMPSGRFRQSHRHLCEAAEKAGFRIGATLDDSLRVENGRAEAGRAYRLIKS